MGFMRLFDRTVDSRQESKDLEKGIKLTHSTAALCVGTLTNGLSMQTGLDLQFKSGG